ncbi:MAG: c-type cytochrome [Planctomycetales bacterium]|nr:c-type cytochrome [Planctomycetales bacterium]
MFLHSISRTLLVGSLAVLFTAAPWVVDHPACADEPAATPVSSITAPPGFRVELLRSAGSEEGSWVSMTFDDRGRLILGLDDVGVARLTLADDARQIRYEKLDESLKHCRGVLYAHNSLYVNATNSQGFYRLRDTNGDGQFDERKLLAQLDYRSRYGHGGNQVVLGPDQQIYLVHGNDVSFPAGVDPASPYRDPHNDWLLPNPHDAGQDDRVGYILRTDPEGRRWEVIAGGFRNQFDLAFNADGEMFTYDADMEWDVGQPWYRPTRINHVVTGGEYGWRWGTGKWPEYYEDSLPSTVDTGLGSPTGVVFGTRGRFPARYRQALFAADWQNGRILLVDLKPQGASYTGAYEAFVEGGPLNVCDLEFGPDGALYFITGGRGSQSGLYRVVWTGDSAATDEAPDPDQDSSRAARQLRQLRRQLENYHVTRDRQAVEMLWPHLSSPDRWLRFAARRALENQEVTAWRTRALQESQPTAAGAALIALCRSGEQADQQAVLAALGRFDLQSLAPSDLLAMLRAYQLAMTRWGQPPRGDEMAERLRPLYPHARADVNHLLGELLIYLQDDSAVRLTLPRLRGTSQEEQIRAARALTQARTGWNLESRRELVEWLLAARSLQGGKLLSDRLREIRDDFQAGLSATEREQLQKELQRLDEPAAQLPASTRPAVRQWAIRDLADDLAAVSAKRSYQRGRQALLAANCLKCHRLGVEGAPIGPDLTSVGRRYDAAKILESLIEPSKVIDPKYRHTSYRLESGRVVSGRPVSVSRTTIVVETDPLTQQTINVNRDEVEESRPAEASPMPSGLLDTLHREEILDLLALLMSGGNPGDQRFTDSAAPATR